MAEDHPSGAAETGADMDYPEHERTYGMFVAMSKWGVIACAALLIAMAFGFFAGGGLFGGVIAFAALIILAYFIL